MPLPTDPQPARVKDSSSLVVIVLASSTAVLFVTLLILTGVLIFWRRKKRKGDLLSYLHVYNMLGIFGSSMLGPQDCKTDTLNRLLVKILLIIHSSQI